MTRMDHMTTHKVVKHDEWLKARKPETDGLGVSVVVIPGK